MAEAIVRLARDPKVSDKLGAKAGDTPGAVRAPMREGAGVGAGRR